ANDDAIRAVKLITARIADACLLGRAFRTDQEGEPEVAEMAEVAEAATVAEAPSEEVVAEPAVVESEAAAPEAAEASPGGGEPEEAGEDEEVKPEPLIDESEFAKELEGLDEQDKMMGDA